MSQLQTEVGYNISELVKIEEENMNLVQQSEILADKYNEVEKKMIDSEFT